MSQADADSIPNPLMRDLSDSLTPDEHVEFQARVRAAMIERPDVALGRDMLEVVVAIKGGGS